MNIKIFCRCSLLTSWSSEGLISTLRMYVCTYKTSIRGEYPCLQLDSNRRSQQSSGLILRLRPRDHRDRHAHNTYTYTPTPKQGQDAGNAKYWHCGLQHVSSEGVRPSLLTLHTRPKAAISSKPDHSTPRATVHRIGVYCPCRTINLPFVLYGCETWSLTFKEERRSRVFEWGVEGNIWA
jgi:hypothetical protein